MMDSSLWLFFIYITKLLQFFYNIEKIHKNNSSCRIVAQDDSDLVNERAVNCTASVMQKMHNTNRF